MFRDPESFKALKELVFPRLETYPSLKIWHAGCSTGEEVYALAILLSEAGLYDRAQIYATDYNEKALASARRGIYPVDKIREYTLNYQKAGGASSLADYYRAAHADVIFKKDLKKNIVFANHNLISDASFGEMHLIVCRNVLIYFDKTLQNRVLQLFAQSLVKKGFLWLGSKEDLKFSETAGAFTILAEQDRIFQLQ